MSTDEYLQRFISSESGIENNFLETGHVSNSQWQPLSQAIASLSELPISINDNSCPSLTEIRSQVRRVSSHYGGVGLVVVDYLQLMAEGTDSRNNMTEQVAEISLPNSRTFLAVELFNRSDPYQQRSTKAVLLHTSLMPYFY